MFTVKIFKLHENNYILLHLVSCPPGSYQVLTEKKLVYEDGYVVRYLVPKCKNCPLGFYQVLQGQTLCMKCPPGYTTLGTGARLRDSCLKQCSPGSFSQRGIVPCIACPNGTYSSAYGSTTCFDCSIDGVSCPNNINGENEECITYFPILCLKTILLTACTYCIYCM